MYFHRGLPSETAFREIACCNAHSQRRDVRAAAAESCHRVRTAAAASDRRVIRPSATVRAGYSLRLQGLRLEVTTPPNVSTRLAASNSPLRPPRPPLAVVAAAFGGGRLL